MTGTTAAPATAGATPGHNHDIRCEWFGCHAKATRQIVWREEDGPWILSKPYCRGHGSLYLSGMPRTGLIVKRLPL